MGNLSSKNEGKQDAFAPEQDEWDESKDVLPGTQLKWRRGLFSGPGPVPGPIDPMVRTGSQSFSKGATPRKSALKTVRSCGNLQEEPHSEPLAKAAGWVADDSSRRASAVNITADMHGGQEGNMVQGAHSTPAVLQQSGGGSSSQRGGSRMGGSSYASRMELLGGIGMAPSRGVGGRPSATGHRGSDAGGSSTGSAGGSSGQGSRGSDAGGSQSGRGSRGSDAGGSQSGRGSDAGGSHCITATISTIDSAVAGQDAEHPLCSGKVLTVPPAERERLRAASVSEYTGCDDVVEAGAPTQHDHSLVLPGIVSCGEQDGPTAPHTVHTPAPPAGGQPSDGARAGSGRRRSFVRRTSSEPDIAKRMASAPQLRHEGRAGGDGGGGGGGGGVGGGAGSAAPASSEGSLAVFAVGDEAGQDIKPPQSAAEQRTVAGPRLSPFVMAASTAVHVSPPLPAGEIPVLSKASREEGRTMQQQALGVGASASSALPRVV